MNNVTAAREQQFILWMRYVVCKVVLVKAFLSSLDVHDTLPLFPYRSLLYLLVAFDCDIYDRLHNWTSFCK